jgi:uncharacterized protein (DUF2164 family)
MNRNVLELAAEKKQALLSLLKEYLCEELDQEIGDLKAELFYDFLLSNFGKAWYNKGILDSAAFFRKKMEDLEVDLDQLYL